jgi:hypothetical protein
MNEPWKDNPKIWQSFCKERGCFNLKEAQLLFTNTRSMKEEYEWFKKGFISRGRSI